MKVWGIMSLVVWGLFLTGLLLFSVLHYLLFQTVLNEREMNKRLEQVNFSQTVRNDLLVPNVTDAISENVEFNRLLAKSDIKASVESAFTEKKTRQIMQVATPAVYAWLDKKSPEISFAVPASTELQVFRTTLAERLDAKLQALSECEAYDVPLEAITQLECMPQYTSADEVLQEIMMNVDKGLKEAPTEINAETVGLTRRQLGQVGSLPDYISYIWALVFLTVPLAALTILYLFLRRRAAGVIAVGIVLAISALLLAGFAAATGGISAPASAVARSLLEASLPLVREKLLFLAALGAGSGIAVIFIGVFWQARHKQRAMSQEKKTSAN